MTFSPVWSAQTFKGFLESPGSILSVCEAGFALGRVIVDEAELLTLAVEPEAQRRGFGRFCLGTFEVEAKRRGAHRAFLEVAEANAAARSLYRRHGWAEDRVRRDYYRSEDGTTIDAIMMSKTLLSV